MTKSGPLHRKIIVDSSGVAIRAIPVSPGGYLPESQSCFDSAAHGCLVVCSGLVAHKQSADGQPLPEQKLLQFQPNHLRLSGEGFRDEDLNAFRFELTVRAQIGFAGVSVDRHCGMTTSTKRTDIVERHRTISIAQIRFSVRTNRDLQSLSP